MSLVGLDYNVVFKMGDMMGIDLSPCMMNKLQKLDRHTIDSQGKDDAEGNDKGFKKAKKRFNSRK